MSSSEHTDDPLPEVLFRASPEDFVVEEIPAYLPSGSGEHLYVTFRKTNLTTEEAVRAIASHLGVDARGAGYAGMKDKRAIATQTASFPLPLARDADAAIAGASFERIEILSSKRHANKLKPGHLLGNRFHITLREVDAGAAPRILHALDEAGKRGVPNAFGPQRFGRDGSNPERALAGKDRGPRDKREQRLLFSSLQSLMFNRVLAARVADGTWATILLGDIAKKREGALFVVGEEDLADAVARSLRGEVSPTGPLFGAEMTWPEGAVRDLELNVLHGFMERDSLESTRRWGEGTRRALRLALEEVSASFVSHVGSSVGNLEVRFVLPKGGYATTVLASAVRTRENAPPRAPDPSQGARS